MSKVVHISSVDEFRTLIASSAFETTIVDFSATWCGPCVGIAPYFETLAQQNQAIQFLKVDVDEFPDISQEANVRAMPTFVIYQSGFLTSEKIQGADRELLDAMVAKYNANKPATSTTQPEAVARPASQPESAPRAAPEKKKSKCCIL